MSNQSKGNYFLLVLIILSVIASSSYYLKNNFYQKRKDILSQAEIKTGTITQEKNIFNKDFLQNEIYWGLKKKNIENILQEKVNEAEIITYIEKICNSKNLHIISLDFKKTKKLKEFQYKPFHIKLNGNFDKLRELIFEIEQLSKNKTYLVFLKDFTFDYYHQKYALVLNFYLKS